MKNAVLEVTQPNPNLQTRHTRTQRSQLRLSRTAHFNPSICKFSSSVRVDQEERDRLPVGRAGPLLSTTIIRTKRLS